MQLVIQTTFPDEFETDNPTHVLKIKNNGNGQWEVADLCTAIIVAANNAPDRHYGAFSNYVAHKRTPRKEHYGRPC